MGSGDATVESAYLRPGYLSSTLRSKVLSSGREPRLPRTPLSHEATARQGSSRAYIHAAKSLLSADGAGRLMPSDDDEGDDDDAD